MTSSISEQGSDHLGSASSSSAFLSVFPSIMLPMSIAVMDQTIVATALPTIARDIGGAHMLSWLVIAYLVAATIAAPIYGRLGDMLGRRRMMLIGLLVFVFGSALCCLATNVEVLIGTRLLQGLGGGGLMTLSQALVGEAVSPRDRGRYQGYLAAVVVASSAFAPVAGGLLTEYFGWRSIFLFSAIVGCCAAFLTMRLPSKDAPRSSGGFDIAGIVLLAFFIAPLLIALGQIPNYRNSGSALIAGLGLVSVAALVLLVVQERRSPSPLLPPSLISKPVVWRADVLAACHGATLVSLTTFMPIYLSATRNMSASESGLVLLPFTIGIGLGSIVTGRLVTKTGRTAIFPSVGLTLTTSTLLACAVFSASLSPVLLSLVLGLAAIFMGTVMGVVQVVVQNAAGAHMLGIAAASVSLSRSVGAAMGTAIVSAVLFAGTKAGSSQSFPALASSAGDAAAPPVVAGSAGMDPFLAAFLVIPIFSAIAAIVAWSLPDRCIHEAD